MSKIRNRRYKERRQYVRRARKHAAPCCNSFTRRTIAGIDSGYKCYLCGKMQSRNSATVDHVQPLSRGGFHCIKNAFIACRKCNVKKGNRTLEEYLKTQSKQSAQSIKQRVLHRIKRRALIDCGGQHQVFVFF